MEIIKSVMDGVPVLKIKGRFDAHEVTPVDEWFTEQVAESKSNCLVIDLEGVNFIDSTALSTMVRGLKICREKGGSLRICTLQQPVRVIFELTRLDKAFEIYPTLNDAVKGIR